MSRILNLLKGKKWYGISQEHGEDYTNIIEKAESLNIVYSGAHLMDYSFMYVLCTSDELKKLLSELGEGYGYWKAKKLDRKLIKRERVFYENVDN